MQFSPHQLCYIFQDELSMWLNHGAFRGKATFTFWLIWSARPVQFNSLPLFLCPDGCSWGWKVHHPPILSWLIFFSLPSHGTDNFRFARVSPWSFCVASPPAPLKCLLAQAGICVKSFLRSRIDFLATELQFVDPIESPFKSILIFILSPHPQRFTLGRKGQKFACSEQWVKFIYITCHRKWKGKMQEEKEKFRPLNRVGSRTHMCPSKCPSEWVLMCGHSHWPLAVDICPLRVIEAQLNYPLAWPARRRFIYTGPLSSLVSLNFKRGLT